MRKALAATILLALVAAGLWCFLGRKQSPRETKARSDASATSSATVTPTRGETRPAPDELERFRSEILPLAEDFLNRIDSLKSDRVILPFDLPITPGAITRIRFIGGPSNTVCTFNVGGHTHFACHIVKRDGKAIMGVNSFVRSGRDGEGAPRSFVQLTGDLVANERYIKSLADTNSYPARNLQEVAKVARRVLNVLRPDDASLYPLSESWQEQRASAVLPFYLFAFAKTSPRGTDPSNLMRDEIMIGFKSTKEGLVLDFFEDNSIAFVGQKPNFR